MEGVRVEGGVAAMGAPLHCSLDRGSYCRVDSSDHSFNLERKARHGVSAVPDALLA